MNSRTAKGDHDEVSHLATRTRFLHALLFLVAVLATARLCYALPQSSQSATASASALRSLAEQGNADAQYNLAQSYLRHDPTNKDYQSALKWLRASVEQGNASAEFLLGYLYEHGEGVPHDYTKAVENYRAAALQGHSSAENNLASLYQHGQGVPKSLSRAFEWYRASAQHGNPVGQCNLATLYYLGSGTRRDYKEAARWFRAAADSGSAEAQNSLAVSYYKGLGVGLDYREAARWLRLAAQNGLPSAETNLAYLYEQGRGLPLDYVAAYAWYSSALAAGDASGANRRQQISHLLTRKQIDEATSFLTNFSSPSQQQLLRLVTGAFRSCRATNLREFVRLLLRTSGRHAIKIYSGRGSRRCYATIYLWPSTRCLRAEHLHLEPSARKC